MMIRLNIGCGSSPILGWINYDNSKSIFISKHPLVFILIKYLNLLDAKQTEYIEYLCKNNNIRFTNASKYIPHKDNSVDVIYTSHMIEHLSRDEFSAFLKEAKRVLKKGGIIRISTPDLHKMVEQYNKTGDGNNFIESTLLSYQMPKSFIHKLQLLISGLRNHHWLYNETSLCNFLKTRGFQNPHKVKPGKTSIENFGNLNLYERQKESLYVEALK